MSDLRRCTALVPVEKDGEMVLVRCTNESWVSENAQWRWCGEHATETNGCPPHLVKVAAEIRKRLVCESEEKKAPLVYKCPPEPISWRARVRIWNGKEEAISENKTENSEAPKSLAPVCTYRDKDDVARCNRMAVAWEGYTTGGYKAWCADHATVACGCPPDLMKLAEAAQNATAAEEATALKSHREHNEQRLVAVLQKALGDRMDDIQRTAHDRTWQVGERVAVLERDLKIVREREAENATMMRATRENDLWRAFERIESLEGRSSGKIAGNDVRCRVCGVAFTSTEQKLGHYAVGCKEGPNPGRARRAAEWVRRFWPAVVVGCVASGVAGTMPLWLPALQAWAGW